MLIQNSVTLPENPKYLACFSALSTFSKETVNSESVILLPTAMIRLRDVAAVIVIDAIAHVAVVMVGMANRRERDSCCVGFVKGGGQEIKQG